MKIGRITRVLEDFKRKETLVEGDNNRKIIISFYYPIDKAWKESRQALYTDLYIPCKDEFINNFKDFVLLDNEDEKKKYLEEIKINIYNNAPISKDLTKYPVIINATGLGAPRDFATFNIEKLVNDGYLVFTIGHFYDSMLTVLPNGELVTQLMKELSQNDKLNILDIRKDDVLFLIDELTKLNNEDEVIMNKLDLEKIGVIGHSLGGAAVFKAAQLDSRIKTVILFDASLQFFNLDKYIQEKQTLSTPVLNFRRGTFDYETSMKMFIDNWKDRADGEKFKKAVLINDQVLRDSDKEQKNLANYLSGYKSFIKLNSSNHMIFSDYSLIIKEKMVSDSLSINKAHDIINEITIKFLDEFLCKNNGRYSEFIKDSEFITLFD